MRRGADYLNTTLLVAQLAKDDVICLTGGVGPHYAPYLAAPFQDRICPPQGAALDGALALAQRQAIK